MTFDDMQHNMEAFRDSHIYEDIVRTEKLGNMYAAHKTMPGPTDYIA